MTMYVNAEVAKRLDVLLSELVCYMSPEVCDGQVTAMVMEARALSMEMISPQGGGLLLSTHAAHYRHCYPVANPETDKGLS
jgi:hypothetical protein